MTREKEVRCDVRPASGPRALCAFTLTRESYGIISGIVGYCRVHDGGKIVIGMSVEQWAEVRSQSQVRDYDRKVK